MSIVKNLYKHYPSSGSFESFSLNIPELEIADQGITVLSGPSGSGKTSLFRILLGLEPCDPYSWEFNGVDLATLPSGDRRIGVVFQDSELFPHMTSEENIRFAAEARGGCPYFPNFLEKWVDALGIGACLKRNVGLLSGGERQRVALARCLATEPRFLLLDEPFSALDEPLKIELRTLLKRAVASLNIPALLVTHDRGDIEDLADHVILLKNGRIVLNSRQNLD